jgi:membrane protein required for colicin V production
MPLNYFDMIVLVLLVLFLLRGVMNGILAEFFGLLGVIGGLWYASSAYQDIVPYLANVIRRPDWREFAAYGLVFFSVLLAVELLARVASKALSFASSPLDKGVGAALGLVRGMVVCSVCLVLLRHFVSDAPFFKDSLITPWLGPLLDFVRLHLPAGLT